MSIALAAGGLAGLSVMLLAFGVAALVSRRGLPEPSPFDAAEAPVEAGPAATGGLMALVGSLRRSPLANRDTRRLQARLEAADLTLRVREWYLVRAAVPLLVFVAVTLIRGSAVIGLVAGSAAALAPGAVVRLRAGRRRGRLEDQLPDAVRIMLNAVEAGRDIRGALLLCAQEGSPEPLRTEFARIQAELRLAVPLDDALQHAAARIGVRDFDVLADGLGLQRQVGGQVGTMLRSTIDTLRARAAFRGRLRAMTAQSRASKWIVSGLVPAVVLALSLLAPSYMTPMFTTMAGWAVLVVAGTMIAIAFYLTGRLTGIEV
jgi:tight adherence protein B